MQNPQLTDDERQGSDRHFKKLLVKHIEKSDLWLKILL